MMMGPSFGEGDEVCGHIDVKVPANVRKRGLTPWKAWKRQWCVAHRGPHEGAPLEVQIGPQNGTDNKLQVASTAKLWRTQSRSKQFAFGVYGGSGNCQRPTLFLAGRSESESQRWMQTIRDLLRPPQIYALTEDELNYSVSLIDNEFTQSAGLNGLHGNLKVSSTEITISDPNSHEVKAIWEWQHLQQFHLAATGRAEDDGRICVLHTSREFKGGAGNIYLFCEEAPKLLQSLLSGGRLQRQLLSPLESPLLPLRNTRRLSRSANDIRSSWTSEECPTPKSSAIAINLRRKHFTFRSNSRDSDKRSSTISDDSGLVIKNRTASSLISASLGLMFSTPGCSEADSDSLHEYQQVGFSKSNEDLVGDMITIVKYRSPRRESGLSIASGIYEEILDFSNVPPDEALYSNSFVMATPPPLPPRGRHIFKNLDDLSSPFGSSPQLSYPRNLSPLAWDLPVSKGRFIWQTKPITSTETEPDYMPMSPGIGFIRDKIEEPIEEQHYMVMSSIDTL